MSYDPKKNQSFEIFYNALSVGWHLRKIAEADPEFMAGEELWERFSMWMGRHNLKTEKKSNPDIKSRHS